MINKSVNSSSTQSVFTISVIPTWLIYITGGYSRLGRPVYVIFASLPYCG